MDKPKIDYDAMPRNVFAERMDYQVEQLFPLLDEVKREQVMHLIECAYLEGCLDAVRIVDCIYQRIT